MLGITALRIETTAFVLCRVGAKGSVNSVLFIISVAGRPGGQCSAEAAARGQDDLGSRGGASSETCSRGCTTGNKVLFLGDL